MHRGKPGERVNDQDGLALAGCGNRILQAGPVVRTRAGQVLVMVLRDDGIAVAVRIRAAPFKLLLDAVALLGIRSRSTGRAKVPSGLIPSSRSHGFGAESRRGAVDVSMGM